MRGFQMSALALLSLLTVSCGQGPVLNVVDARVTLSPVITNPSSLHFTIKGGPEDVKLLRIYSPSAIRTEIHDSSKDPVTGMMSMQKLEQVFVPKGTKITFDKGGKHVMVWGINKIPRRTGEIKFEFLFSNGDRILLDDVPVRKVDGNMPDEYAG